MTPRTYCRTCSFRSRLSGWQLLRLSGMLRSYMKSSHYVSGKPRRLRTNGIEDQEQESKEHWFETHSSLDLEL